MKRTTRNIAGRGRRWRAAAVAMTLGCAGTLSACGGGGGGSAPAPVSQAAPPTPIPVQVSAAGDSTMAGLEYINGQYVATDVVRTDLQTDLQTVLGPTVTVVDNARSGATLQNMLDGTGFTQTYAQYLASVPSQIVIENFALNDYNDYSAATFQQYLITFITLTEQAGKIPVLEEPNPGCNPATGQFWANLTPEDSFTPIIDQVAAAYNVALVKQYDALMALPNYCSMLSDGSIHPDSALYAIKAQNEAAVLIPIIQKLMSN